MNEFGILNTEMIPGAFPKSVIEQSIAASRIRTANYLARRLDLRSKTVFTFGETPDSLPECAFSIYPNGIGWQLGIHIADVSEFVPDGSPIDKEARKRLASVSNSFLNVNMLPEKLVELASLTVGNDRLTLSVLLDINSDGTLESISCEESIVRVATHCVFDEVNQLDLASDTSSVFALREKYAPISKKISALYEVAAMFYANRLMNGGLDITLFRTLYERNSEGKVSNILRIYEPDIRAMVREIGFFVSQSLGELLFKKKIPAIYVGKGTVSKEMLEYLSYVIGLEGEYKDDISRASAILEKSKGTSYYEFVCNSIISDMPADTFSDKPIMNSICVSDKVLSLNFPISRYSDILTQRILKSAIAADYDPKNLNLNKARRSVSEAAEEATKVNSFIYDAVKANKEICSLQYLEFSGKTEFTGYPIYKDESGSVIIVLEYGIEAQMPAENAKDFEFEPAKPYKFEIIALGTENEPTVVKQAE